MKRLLFILLIIACNYSFSQQVADSTKSGNKTAIPNPQLLYVGKTKQCKVYVHLETICKRDGGFMFWIKGEYPKFTYKKMTYYNANVIDLIVINCETKKFTILKSIANDVKGDIIYSDSLPYHNIITKSIGKNIFNMACVRLKL